MLLGAEFDDLVDGLELGMVYVPGAVQVAVAARSLMGWNCMGKKTFKIMHRDIFGRGGNHANAEKLNGVLGMLGRLGTAGTLRAL